jgi:hypothetical protein
MASRKCAFTGNLPFVLVGQRSQSHLRLAGCQSGMQAGPPIAKKNALPPGTSCGSLAGVLSRH